MAALRQGYNDLLAWCQQNGERGKQLMDEYMEEKNFNELGKIMNEFTYGSGVKVWWQCKDCNYEWQATINSRVYNKTKCPACINGEPKYIKGKTTLKEWCQKEENIAWGEILLKEWDYEANATEGNYIDNISYGTDKKVHWICSECNEKFIQKIHYRTADRCSCPNCNTSSTSYPEQFIFWSLKQIYKTTENRSKQFKIKGKATRS